LFDFAADGGEAKEEPLLFENLCLFGLRIPGLQETNQASKPLLDTSD
jgi:hypothetical protein